MRLRLALIVGLLALSGCLGLPKPPDDHQVVQIEPPRSLPAGVTVYQTVSKQAPKRNLVFGAIAGQFQKYFGSQIQALYRSGGEVRIEDIAWWIVAPELRELYDHVILIPHDRVGPEALQASFEYLESLHEPYDVFLFTHGISNYIITSKGQPMLGWKEIDAWKGVFPSLSLVFLQSCYGGSLTQDWLGTGARAVVSYAGENTNFFYPITFFRALKKSLASPGSDEEALQAAYREANARVFVDVRKSALDKFVIKNALQQFGGVKDFSLEAPLPDFVAR